MPKSIKNKHTRLFKNDNGVLCASYNLMNKSIIANLPQVLLLTTSRIQNLVRRYYSIRRRNLQQYCVPGEQRPMSQPTHIGRVSRKDQPILTARYIGFLRRIRDSDSRRTSEESRVSTPSV